MDRYWCGVRKAKTCEPPDSGGFTQRFGVRKEITAASLDHAFWFRWQSQGYTPPVYRASKC
jgi:hypothetical protein